MMPDLPEGLCLTARTRCIRLLTPMPSLNGSFDSFVGSASIAAAGLRRIAADDFLAGTVAGSCAR
jgi:hypothetical protein